MRGSSVVRDLLCRRVGLRLPYRCVPWGPLLAKSRNMSVRNFGTFSHYNDEKAQSSELRRRMRYALNQLIITAWKFLSHCDIPLCWSEIIHHTMWILLIYNTKYLVCAPWCVEAPACELLPLGVLWWWELDEGAVTGACWIVVAMRTAASCLRFAVSDAPFEDDGMDFWKKTIWKHISSECSLHKKQILDRQLWCLYEFPYQ